MGKGREYASREPLVRVIREGATLGAIKPRKAAKLSRVNRGWKRRARGGCRCSRRDARCGGSPARTLPAVAVVYQRCGPPTEALIASGRGSVDPYRCGGIRQVGRGRRPPGRRGPGPARRRWSAAFAIARTRKRRRMGVASGRRAHHPVAEPLADPIRLGHPSCAVKRPGAGLWGDAPGYSRANAMVCAARRRGRPATRVHWLLRLLPAAIPSGGVPAHHPFLDVDLIEAVLAAARARASIRY
jgi:hypothetical protein